MLSFLQFAVIRGRSLWHFHLFLQQRYHQIICYDAFTSNDFDQVADSYSLIYSEANSQTRGWVMTG